MLQARVRFIRHSLRFSSFEEVRHIRKSKELEFTQALHLAKAPPGPQNISNAQKSSKIYFLVSSLYNRNCVGSECKKKIYAERGNNEQVSGELIFGK